MRDQQCRCATECEWLPEHYKHEHHPDCPVVQRQQAMEAHERFLADPANHRHLTIDDSWLLLRNDVRKPVQNDTPTDSLLISIDHYHSFMSFIEVWLDGERIVDKVIRGVDLVKGEVYCYAGDWISKYTFRTVPEPDPQLNPHGDGCKMFTLYGKAEIRVADKWKMHVRSLGHTEDEVIEILKQHALTRDLKEQSQ